MKFEILIQFIDNFNDELALLIKMLKPKHTLLISNRPWEKEGKLQEVIVYIEQIAGETEVEWVYYNEEDPEALRPLIVPYLNENAAINLGGASPLEMMLLTQLKQDYKFTILYPDIKQNMFYILGKEALETKKLSQCIGTLAVADYLHLSGGVVLNDAKEKYERPIYQQMLDYLLRHYKNVFSKIRHLFKPSYVHFCAPVEEDFYFEIVTTQSSEAEKKLLIEFLKALQSMKWIKHFEEKKQLVTIYAMDKELEHYLTSGAWLEHVTYYMLLQMPEIQDVHTGFKFAWQQEVKYIHNELDVVGTLRSTFIGISCKDTDKYDYQTLNELEVYATRLGGTDAIKMLVTTMLPQKSSTLERASQMGIEVIVLEDHLSRLQNQLLERTTRIP